MEIFFYSWFGAGLIAVIIHYRRKHKQKQPFLVKDILYVLLFIALGFVSLTMVLAVGLISLLVSDYFSNICDKIIRFFNKKLF